MKSIKHFRAEIWDKLQYCYKPYNDHQIHCAVYLNGMLDIDTMRKAVLKSIELNPILGCRFVIGRFKAFWEQSHLIDEESLFSFVESDSPEDEINSFLTSRTDELQGPQIRLRIVRSVNKDTLCAVVNHMVCDGAGFRDYMYLLSSLYTMLINVSPDSNTFKHGSRNSDKIYSGLTTLEKLKTALLANENKTNKNTHSFPFEAGYKNPKPFIVKHKIHQDKFQIIKAYGRARSVTVNDVVLTAYYRAMYKILGLKGDEALTIPSMVDLRRYIPNKTDIGMCNHSSMIMCTVNMCKDDDFDDTLQKVHEQMALKKSNYPGLHGLRAVNSVFKLLPFRTAIKVFGKNFVNPKICATNIGIIDSDRLIFYKTPVEDAFITSSIKYSPYFQLAFSSFKDTITFCVNLYGADKDRETISKFFTLFDAELNNIVLR